MADSKGGRTIPGTGWQAMYLSTGIQVNHRDPNNCKNLTAAAALHTTKAVRGGNLCFPDFRRAVAQGHGACTFMDATETHAASQVSGERAPRHPATLPRHR